MLRVPGNASRKRTGRYLIALQYFQDPPDFVHAPFQSEIHDPSQSADPCALPSPSNAAKQKCIPMRWPQQSRSEHWAAMALVNRHFAKKAERDNPASGRFLDVSGVRLHYVERGSGDPLVLLHGNGINY